MFGIDLAKLKVALKAAEERRVAETTKRVTDLACAIAIAQNTRTAQGNGPIPHDEIDRLVKNRLDAILAPGSVGTLLRNSGSGVLHGLASQLEA